MKRGVWMLSVAVILLLGQNLWAGEADVIDVRARKTAPETYQLDVTVRHADSGWDHYADKWEVLDPSGVVLGTRVLLHPHVDEQPFIRSLAGLNVPHGIKQVTVRAHDKVHGWRGKTVTITLP